MDIEKKEARRFTKQTKRVEIRKLGSILRSYYAFERILNKAKPLLQLFT